MAPHKKEKCKYWEKCFRKDPAHKRDYLHPGDKEETKPKNTDIEMKDETVSKPTLKKCDTDILMDDETIETKPKLKRNRTHAISDDEDDEPSPPPVKKLRSRTVSVTKETGSGDSKKDEEDDAVASGSSEDVYIPKCQYWDECYRKDPNHLKQYRHPGDGRKSSRPKPAKKLEEGVQVSLTGGYRLKKLGSDYTCTCIGWKIQKNATNKRTCKHLREYLGDNFEKARIGQLPVEKRKPVEPSQRFQHITISLLLAHKYEAKNCSDPVGWWISEKLDGVRAFWNGKCFYSRLGNPFYAPKWFTKDLPKDFHLDGELFGGRKKFQQTIKIVKNAECADWNKIKYCVFDSPNMGKDTFEKRTKTVKDWFDTNKPQYAEFVDQYKCTSKQQLEDDLKKMIKLGGEGLMIRQPGSVYERCRSKTLLKLKKFYDAEAVVIGYDPGKGRFTGAVGALRCKMECGKVFKVGSGLTDKDHRKPPKIGSIITYKFQEYTNSGSPRFPTYLGVRIDATEPKDAELPSLPDDI